jgi:hypothetical protein
MYNVQYYIQKLEDMTEYSFPFERVKQIKEQLTGKADGDKPEDAPAEEDDEEPRI